LESLGIYVHIPYCLKKCNYCDFVSEPISCASIDPDRYSSNICSDIEIKSEVYRNKYYVDTIFFGGGTPTCIGCDLIGRILLCIKKNFKVCDDAEISIEANPETVKLKYFEVLKFLGFNRVSMGVQSLDDNVLSIMGRVHTADKAREAFEIVKDAGFENINLDLMLGVPGQSFNVFKSTIDEVISMGPQHISFYGLQLEEGTAFYEDYRNGKIDIPEWEENRKMYHYAVDTLKTFGYHHYEISNAAKPGYECKHNMKYWTMKPYLGFGPAAHSFIDGKRTDEDNPDLETDWIFTGLRLIDGTDFGKDFCTKYEGIISELVHEEYILKEGSLLRFSDKGLDNTNYCMGRFING